MARVGLTALDEAKACPGYLVYAPMGGDGQVFLIDLNGNEAHSWKLPHPAGLYGYLLPNGNLFYGGKIQDESWDRFSSFKRFKGGVILEVDWEGNVVWEHYDPDHHHDARRTPEGGAIYLTVELMDPKLAAQVKGGVPGSDKDGMWADVIVEVNASGQRVWEWHAAEHLDPDRHILTFNDLRDEWSHANTVVPLSDGRVMFSFRNISTVGIIDKKSGDITWQLGYDTLSQQHDPSMLANGNVLIYDNGSHKKNMGQPFSQVIEIDPATNEIVWEYRDTPPYNFFSAYISGARRLPNGNTLITEGMYGRIFQVTPEKEVVWEYINPHYREDVEGNLVNRVFRSTFVQDQDLPVRVGG